MRHPIFAVLTLCTLAVAGNFNAIAQGFSPPSPPTGSGIEGQVSIGPTCPVVRPGIDCSARPYQATITVLDSKGQVVARFQTDAQGHFEVSLKPGKYTLRPESPGVLPRAAAQTIAVTGKKFTHVQINYDSGIR